MLEFTVKLHSLVHIHASCVHAAALYHTTVGVFVGAVIFGHVTLHSVAWATPLYVAAKSHVCFVDAIVFQFASKFTVYVTFAFVVCAYKFIYALVLDDVNVTFSCHAV